MDADAKARMLNMVQKARVQANGRETEMVYVEADKYLKEVEGYICFSYECNKRFRKDYQWAMKRRLTWGPDSVVLVNTFTRELVRPGDANV